MTKTFEEVKEELKRIDEVSLLEVLDIASEDLVDRFQDKIEEKIDDLAREFEDEEEDTTEAYSE
jgi:hypothetical protein